MTENTETLIAGLAGSASSLEKPIRFGALFGTWLAGLCLYIALVLFSGFYPLRADMPVALTQPLFVTELLMLALTLAGTLAASAALSVPDQYQKKFLTYIPLLASGGLLMTLALAWRAGQYPLDFSFDGWQCLLCIAALSLLPALAIFWQTKRMAPVVPDKAGMMAFLCAFSTGALILRLSEPTNSIPHVVIWHYLPMLAVSLFGSWLGSRVLRW